MPEATKLDDRAISLPMPEFILQERIEARGGHPEHYHLDMVYVVKVPMQEVKHQESESHGIKWFSRRGKKDRYFR